MNTGSIEEASLRVICLDGSGGGTDLGAASLASSGSRSGPVWIHLDYTTDEGSAFLEAAERVPPDIRQALSAEMSRPRRLTTGQGLLAVLRAVNLNSASSPEDMVSIRIWLEPERIITTKARSLQSVAFVREALARGEGPKSTSGVFCALFERITDLGGDVVADVSESVSDLEIEADTDNFDAVSESLPVARRRIIALRRHLGPQREAMQRLLLDHDPRFSEPQAHRLREAVELLHRQIEELDAARERVGGVQDQLSAHLSSALERRTYVLSIIAALFVPLGFVTGLLGINVGGIPGADNPLGFITVVAICALIAGVGFAILRTRRWL